MTEAQTEKGWFEAKLDDPAFRRAYAREDLIEAFLHEVERVMSEQGISRAQLAQRLGCSAANVTRILRRTSNLTVATMAEMALALDLRVRVQMESFSAWITMRQEYTPVARMAPLSIEDRRWPEALAFRVKQGSLTPANGNLEDAA